MKYLSSGLFLILSFVGSAQTTLTLPRESQYASITQRVGITDITVVYHSPAVKGRKIFGSLVPYDNWWRAGANENTTISFSHEVSIEKQKIPAGIYGLHMIPGTDMWTIIFSNNHTSWGSFFYKKEEDALRVLVKPQAHGFSEWLTYSFVEKSATSTKLSLIWDKLEVPILIEVDVKNIVLANIRNELRGTPAFTWQGWFDAANFCFENKINYEEAQHWIEKANKMKPGDFTILRLKASLLEASGNLKGAEIIMKDLIANAKEADLNAYGYELLADGKNQEAIGIFNLNVKRHSKSWNVYDSLAEALEKSGDKAAALKQYELALKNAPEDQKKRIEQRILVLK
ncbi:MAG: DUF2911 domain-containing protein [Bacteroidota bacterium]|nr:DUF2911 domain-containing protein [Bacteroidota bacterium]